MALSLALNYWLAGRAVLGFHLVNILGHIAAALALLCVARRCLVATGEASGAAATGLAFAIAAVWVSHPLHSDAIGHIIYRNETLMALFYFLTLYGALRAFEGEKKWLILAPLACLASMACKEVAVSLPLMVFGFDVFFGAKSARAAFAKRGAFYAALAFSWIGLAFFVASGERGDSVGLGHADVVGVADYLRTQMIAVPILPAPDLCTLAPDFRLPRRRRCASLAGSLVTRRTAHEPLGALHPQLLEAPRGGIFGPRGGGHPGAVLEPCTPRRRIYRRASHGAAPGAAPGPGGALRQPTPASV